MCKADPGRAEAGPAIVADGVTIGLAVGCGRCCGMIVVVFVVVDIISASVCEDDMQVDVANVILCIMLFAGVDAGAADALVTIEVILLLLLQTSPPTVSFATAIGDCCIYSQAELLLYDTCCRH